MARIQSLTTIPSVSNTDVLAIEHNTGTGTYKVPISMLLSDVYMKSEAVAKADIVDNLTSTATDKPGSANMLRVLNDNIANNYTDYVENDYQIRVARLGKMVVVSGIIYGTGTAEYCGPSLPSPAMYNDGVVNANAVVFYARNQLTGTVIQLRCGGNFRIYREASMTNGVQYAFGFAYCAA